MAWAQVYMLGVIFVFAAAWSIELAIYHYSMKGTKIPARVTAAPPPPYPLSQAFWAG